MSATQSSIQTRAYGWLTRQYRKVMQRYERMEYFGLEGRRDENGKGTPFHVNTRTNPRPLINNLGGIDGNRRYRKKGRLTPGMDRKHLTGKRATFHLNRPDRRTALYAIDVDDKTSDVEFAATCAYIRETLQAIWPDLVPFIEPGRSYPRKAGGYGWFRVRWGRMDPVVRREYERELNRRMKELFGEGPQGVVYDALKGTTTFETDNPLYDPELAESPGCPRPMTEVNMGTDTHEHWVEWKGAMKVIEEEGGDPASVGDLPRRRIYIPQTLQQEYESGKALYGIGRDQEVDPSVPFEYDPRLEPKIRHYGTLVTRPCFKALSRTRSDNIADFIAWESNSAGCITRRQVEAILDPQVVANLRDFERAVEDGDSPTMFRRRAILRRRNTSSVSAVGVAYYTGSLPEPDVSISWQRFLDDGLEQHVRYVAAAQIAMRYTGGDVDAAIDVALALVELPAGPATEERHDGRIDHVIRCVQYVDLTYDPILKHDGDASSSSGEGPYFERGDIENMERRLNGRISNQLIQDVSQAEYAKVSRRQIAVAACWLMKNIVTGNKTEVPVTSIKEGLKYFGMSANGSTVAAIMTLLSRIGMVRLARDYSTATHRCRCYIIHEHAIIPDWLAPFVTPDVQRQVPVRNAPVAAQCGPAVLAAVGEMAGGHMHGPRSSPSENQYVVTTSNTTSAQTDRVIFEKGLMMVLDARSLSNAA